MKRSAFITVLAVLTFVLTACPQTVTPPPQPPVTPNPDPTTFPVMAVSGTIPNWSGGEAYLTLAAGVGVSSTPEGEEVVIAPPVYQTALSATGAFTVQLAAPAAAELIALTCGTETYTLGLLTGAVVSSVPEPTQADEFLGAYTLGPPDSLVTDAVWVYSAEAHEIDASCTLPSSSPAATKLNLVPGWNQAILTGGKGARLESGAIPTSFIWSEF